MKILIIAKEEEYRVVAFEICAKIVNQMYNCYYFTQADFRKILNDIDDIQSQYDALVKKAQGKGIGFKMVNDILNEEK